MNKDRFIHELADFISIPSISAMPKHIRDVINAAEWVKNRLISAGAEGVSVMKTGGHPAVYGEWLKAGPDKPTVLIYGHYDVQPVDPLSLWETDPFKPKIRDGLIFGRGASDDKGSMLTPIIAFEAILNTQEIFPINVKFLFEGQEEIASPQMSKFVAQNKKKLACDMIFSADGGQWSETEACIVVALKGILGFEIEVRGPKSDQHSGLRGAAIANPIMALAQLISSMKSRDGKIAIQGFYDNVIELSASDRNEIAKLPFKEKDFLQAVGVDELFGEDGFSTLERIGARPTLDLNGVYGGYQGDGVKTVLPSSASAKITCRLVAEQDPKKVFEQVKKHVAAHTPPGVKVRIDLSEFGDPFQIPENHLATAVAREVLAEVYGKEPYVDRIGGSIPILPIFLRELGVHTTLFAFGLEDENMHAPNEFFRLTSFYKGQVSYCKLFNKLGTI